MLVRDMVQAIENRELKVQDLANKYNVSDRTIQIKIKELGLVWVATESKYTFMGKDKSIYDLPIDEVFKKIPHKKKSEPNSKKASKEVASTLQETIQVAPETTSANASKKSSDNIDRLLSGKKAKKVYRGFYFDTDVISVIDSVESGVKSELINECLRSVFKSKNLL
ncbi:hypothetical protein [Bacillus sp. ISL-57]|uniref:hypothetical protein n=1 Tax=Bacillus sp. ISL-57 TaxID=2819135 RepID=UPI001BE9C393|nr:hypothetical protein [Bacillus sp. ISL-57]MBT2719048.1 hypothetical protein [Bacillus sp. ISL-57]